MKKLSLILVMLIMLLLYGCAASDNPYLEASIHGNVYYDWETMTFTNLDSADILSQTGDLFDDFVILHQLVTETEFTQSEQSAYLQLFTVMDELVTSSNVSYKTLSTYSSSRFNQLGVNNSITITAIDIITFNAYKSLVLSLSESYANGNFTLSKRSYLNERLDRDLTNEEFLSLELLQDHYYNLARYNQPLPLIESTFEELLQAFKDTISYEPTVDDLAKLQEAYDIITSLGTN